MTGASRDTLLAAYAPLGACLPSAFALEGERDRREPIVVRALLEQVAGLEPLMVDKLMAAGLGTLAALFAARADEIAAVTGIPDAIAARAAARIQAFRRATPAALATIDPAATIRELAQLLEQLRTEHTAFEEAARGWSGARGCQEAACAAAAGDFLANHDRAGAPGRDRLRAAPAEAGVRAADRRSGPDRRQPGGRGPEEPVASMESGRARWRPDQQ